MKWKGAQTCNLAVWKEDFYNINGFDFDYMYSRAKKLEQLTQISFVDSFLKLFLQHVSIILDFLSYSHDRS